MILSLLGTACGGGSGTDTPADETAAADTASAGTPATDTGTADSNAVDTSPGEPIDVVAAASDDSAAAADGVGAGGSIASEADRAVAMATTGSNCEKVPPYLSPVIHHRVTEYGAVPDDGRDDTDAIERALAATNPGEMLVFPVGRYQINRFIRIRKPGITLAGETGAIIHATNPDSMALVIEQDRTTVQNLTFTAITDKRRTSAQHSRITVAAGNSDGTYRWVYDTVIRDNKILPSGDPGTPGANSASTVGILLLKADRFLIANNTVARTLADGIHVTKGSRNGRILNNTVRENGDDSIAVVSYAGKNGSPALGTASSTLSDWTNWLDQNVDKNILIAGNRVGGQYWGRGISVVGGRKVTITHNTVDNAPIAAGILLAREANYETFGTRNVLVEGNAVRNVQNMPPTYDALRTYSTSRRTGHGAVEIHASQFTDETASSILRDEMTVADVIVRNNTIERSTTSGVRMGAANNGTMSATNSSGQTVYRKYATAILASPSIQTSRFNSVSLEPVSVLAKDLQTRGVNCSGNLRDGSAYQPAVCTTNAPAVTGATLSCSTEGVLQ